jgi:hypothetical protein
MTTFFSLDGSAGSSLAVLPGTASFLSRTSEFAATFSASAWCAGLWIWSLVMLVYGTELGGSNSPVSMRSVNRWTSALSMTPSLSTPALIASWMLAPAGPETCWPVAVFVQTTEPLTVLVVQPGGAQS